MKPLIPYLFFNGNCREAMQFYKECFGGKLEIMTYDDAPSNEACPPGDKNKVMHACLSEGDFSLMASDNPQGPPVIGDNIALSIQCDTIPEIQKRFAALKQGGKVTMELADTFWGAHFGMLIDKYGFHWMLNCPLKK